MAGAALAFVAVAALHALTVPTFAPPDEASHVGYAVLVGQGRLPTIDTPIPEAEMPRVDRTLGARDAQRQDIWTANHPPLFYVLAAGPVRVGLMSAPSLAGIRAARLLPIALAALGIVLVALLALELAPGRPQVAVAAAGLTALLPSFVHNSSILYNDALAFLTSTATLLVAVIVVLRGPSTARLAALALTASATALTRSSGLLVAATAVAAALVASWLHERPAGARVALRRAGLVAAAVVATCGWFYARNLLLYGDLTGAEALLAKFDRSPGSSVGELLRSGAFWVDQQQRLWDYSLYMYRGWGRTRTDHAALLTLVPLAGLALAGWARLRRGPAAPAWPRLAAWALGLVACLELSLIQFVSRGGGSHERYLFPALGVLAVGGALGLAALPGARRGLATVGLLVVMAAVNLTVLEQYLHRFDWGVPANGRSGLRMALDNIGVGQPALVLAPALGLLALGLAAQAAALWALGGPADRAPALAVARMRYRWPRRSSRLTS